MTEVRAMDHRARAAIGRHPIHPMIIPFPIAFLVAAFVSDLIAVFGGSDFWMVASFWLLGAGWVTGLIAGFFGAAELLLVPKATKLLAAWFHAATAVPAVLLALVNWFIRYDDGGPATDYSPVLGAVLSGLTVALLLVAGWLGGHLTYVHRVGVTPASEEPVQREPGYGRIRSGNA